MKLLIVGVLLCLTISQAKEPVEEKVEEEQITKGKPAPAGAATNATTVPVPSRFGGGTIIRGSHEYTDGFCSGYPQVKDHVFRPASPYVTKRITYTWDGYGYYRATCVVVKNHHGHTGATVKLLYGGVGETYVVLDLLSAFGGELDFNVEVWASGGGGHEGVIVYD